MADSAYDFFWQLDTQLKEAGIEQNEYIDQLMISIASTMADISEMIENGDWAGYRKWLLGIEDDENEDS